MRKVACSTLLVCTLSLPAACGGDTDEGSTTTSPPATTTTSPSPAPSTDGGSGPRVDVTALTATTVCEALPAATVSEITQHSVSDGQGEVGACNWMAPQAVRVRLFPPTEWSPHGESGRREVPGIGTQAYVARGSFGNGYLAEALLSDRAVAAIIPADWATEEMTVELLRAAVESLG